MRLLLFLLISVLASGHASWTQEQAIHPEAGHSLLTNFLPASYDAEPQNWAFVEDHRGILYAGNGSGVLEYDGISWKQLSLPNRTLVRSLACDKTGRIWVGGKGELGYLTSDSLGSTIFKSLRERIPEEYSDFQDVWNTFATDEGIYFNTTIAVFRWDGKALKAWPSQTSFHMAFMVAGTFYVRQFGIGLMSIEGSEGDETLRLIPGGERFADTRIYVMLPYDDERILIGTREENLFIFDGQQFEVFPTEVDHLLTRGGLYQPGVVLPEGRFGLGTFSEGFLIIDRLGKLVEHINNNTGLQDNTVFFAYVDQGNNVWLGMDKGIARIEIGTEFTRYDAKVGLPSTVASMARYNGQLFVGEVNGLKRLHTSSRSFQSVESPLFQVFSLLPLDDELLVSATNEGLYRLKGNRVSPVRESISSDFRAISLHQWSRNPNIVAVGLTDGMAILRRSPDGWIDEGRVPDLGMDSWTIAEGSLGELWLGSESGIIARVGLPFNEELEGIDLKKIEVSIFGKEHGLPGGNQRVHRVGDRVYISALGERVFSFNEAEQRFYEDSIFQGASSGHPLGYFRLREDSQGRVWIATTYGPPVVALPQEDGTYSFTALRQFYSSRIVDVYPDTDGIVWFMGEDELIRYQAKSDLETLIFPPPLIRQVRLGEHKLLYGGAGTPVASEISHGSGAIRFSYASPGGTVQPRFRTQLEGLEKKISSWSTVSEKIYTHLPPRVYHFRVEAEGGGEASFHFTVLPPWYLTWWAITVYAIAVMLLIYVFVRWRTSQLKQKQKELVQEVRNATKEIRTQKEEVETQRDLLRVQHDLVVEQKKEITDSISYAQRIQSAVLPNQEYMDEIMPEYFVLFKPRDIVSGDFYWVKEVQDHLVIVGADCTGHGVPGAFMSMLGITLLNSLIGDTCYEAPSAILEQLRNKVKELMLQKGEGETQKDGMDMVIAVLNKSTRELHYSGANNPLYLVRRKKLSDENEKYHLIELKGDKQPVGVHWEESKFTNHSLNLQKQDAIYLFTDGIVDQYGGEDRKKYKSVKFKQLLLSIQEEPMEKQKQLVDDAFESWRGNLEQIDDVCVVGVRV